MWRRSVHVGVIALAAALGGCAGLRGANAPIPAPLATPDGPVPENYLPPPLPEDLLKVTDSMREFVDRYVNRNGSRTRSLMDLANALLQSGVLGVQYDEVGTYTAAEMFRRRSGNCVSFSLLFVALAREVGLDARLQEVRVAPQWDRQQDVLVKYRHINVTGDLGRSSTYTMDFKPDLARVRVDAHSLSDAEAFAHFYNNRASSYLLEGQLVAAHAWFMRAIELAPRSSFLWSNFALLYQRAGQGDESERLLRYALRLDPGNVSAINNLAGLLEAAGRSQEADDLKVRAFNAQRRNPYYLLAMAQRADAHGRPGEALSLLERAIELDNEEALFYETAARIARSLDRSDLARRYEATADSLGGATADPPGRPRLEL